MRYTQQQRVVWVRSHDRYHEIAHFDPASAHLEVGRADAPNPDDWDALSGTYHRDDERLMVLYRDEAGLVFVCDRRLLPLTSGLTAERLNASGKHRLVLRQAGEIVLDVTYGTSNPIVSVEEDLTPFVEEEDFDYGLHVASLVNDPGRQARYYTCDHE